MSGGSFYATRVLSDDPRFYLRLGEASGFTAYDETANGLDGTIHYSTYGPTLGQPSLINDSDPSMHFHGGYVRIYDDTVDSSEYSVEAWISKDDSGTARGFMGRAAPDSDLIMALRFWVDANDKVNVGITHWCCTDPIGQASFLQAVGSTTIVPGVAYHVAATVRQGELLRLYVNGVEEASAGPVRIPYFVGSQWAGSGHWRIGNSGNNASPWLGEIDEWAGYDYALTPDRIAANYIVGLTGSEFNPFETLGSRNPSELHRCQGCLGDPVNTATGNFFEDFTDLAIPGRGVPLDFSRTYNSLAASIDGPLGRGWSHSYMTSLQFVGDTVTVNQENGSQVAFTLENGVYTAPPRVTATLVENPDGTFTLTRMRRTFLTFNASGKLIKQQDLNGKGASPQYSTTLAYNGAGRLATVTDPANRTLTFDYWPSGLLKSVMDSASPARTVSFAYDGDGNLSDVTDVGGGVTHMTYDAAHRLVTLLDPNQEDASSAEPLTIGYDASGRVGWQTDTLGLLTEFDYATVPGSTLYTDPKGNKILHLYEAGQLVSETRGYGTSKAATWEYEFDETLGVTSVTDPNNHVTTSSYDGRGNLVSRIVDPGGLNRETIYEYDSLNDLTLIEDPSGVATTMTYDANGNLETTETPLYAADGVTVLATRTTELDYPSAAHPGDVGSMIDANNKTWTYSYDTAGNLKSATDPLGNKTAFCHDSIGRRTQAVTPKGTAGFTCPASPPDPPGAYTTTFTYNAFSHVLVAADALNHKTTRTYDANGNLKTLEDPDGNITEYSYDAGNRLTLVTRADSTELENEYWPDGSLKTQIDGANKATSYAYDPLGHLTSVTDPLLRATTFSFDAVGNVKSKASPGGSCGASPSGCTTYTYDAADELKTISYSDGTTPNVTGLTYDPNGRRTGMTDGTGTSSYVWDSLGRLKQSTDGAGKTVKYGYDLKGQVTSITYPSGADHVVTRTYDDAGRLATVTDWLDQETHFDFDANSNPDLVTYPNGTTAEYGVDAADRLMSIIDKKGTSTFASFGYTRTDANLLASGTFTGVTQPNETYGYSDLNQVTSVNTTGYDYDPADNLTQMGASTLAYDSANELTAKYGSITYVGGGANEDATGAAGQIVVTLSAAPQAGDQILIAADNKAGQNANMPAGYPVVGTFAGAGGAGEELRVFRRTADGTEGTSITVSFNQGTNVHAKAAAVVIYRGVDPSNPIDVLGTPGTTASGTSVTAPSVTAAQAGEQLVMFQSALNNTLGAGWTGQPAGMTKRVNSGPNIPMVALAIADKPLSAAGATGTQTATLSQSASLLGLLVALRRESTTYTYDLRGNRKTKTPPLGAATSYTYDQADRLKTIGSTSYTYNGDGLRMSKTVSGVTTPFAWNLAEGLPLLLSDNVNSYVYGPGGLPLEQIPFQTISYVGGGANHDATGTATTFAVSLSATPQANDQILVAVDNKAGQNASIGGTGWVTVGTYAGAGSAGEELRVFRKTATAIESNSVTVNFNQGTNVHAKAAAVVIYRGVDPTTPIDVIGTPGTTASGTSVTAPSVTTSGQVEQLVMFQSALNNTLGANWSGQPAGMTKRVNSGPNIPMVALAIADKPLNAAGATGAQTATLSQSASLLSLLIALKPPPPPVLYFHQDQLGSTRLLTDADGNIAATYTYDAYGTTTAKTGSSVTPLQYAGQYTDAETGFHFMRARYYDPITGQFLSRDPSGNSMQRPYAYASNSPVNAVDVNGLYPCAPPGFVGPAEDDCPIRFSDFTGFGNQEHGQVVVTLPSSSLDVTLTNVQFFDFMFNVGVAGKDSERFNLAPFTSRTVHLSPSGSYLTDDWCRIYVYDIKIESRLGPWAGFFLGGIIGSDASNVFDLPPFYGVGISWLATSPPPYNTIQGTFWEQG